MTSVNIVLRRRRELRQRKRREEQRRVQRELAATQLAERRAQRLERERARREEREQRLELERRDAEDLGDNPAARRRATEHMRDLVRRMLHELPGSRVNLEQRPSRVTEVHITDYLMYTLGMLGPLPFWGTEPIEPYIARLRAHSDFPGLRRRWGAPLTAP